MNDFELLLLSWAQMCALELVIPSKEHSLQKGQIEKKLLQEFQISQVNLVGRTLDEYAISYHRGEENHLIRFDSEEVESIYEA